MSSRLDPGRAPRARWQVWVDTGGTFTDCVAVGPEGEIRRAKVLSNGCLRGRIAERLDDRRLRLAGRWSLPEDFFRGARFRLLEAGAEEVPVAGFDPGPRELELAAALPEAAAGAAFEICSAEEAPLLAARVATGLHSGAVFGSF